MNEPLLLAGLDGSNPLAFLAALGTLRSLSLEWPNAEIRMCWGMADGRLRPLLTSLNELEEEALLQALIKRLRPVEKNPALTFADDLSVTQDVFRETARLAQAQASRHSQVAAEFMAAFGCDVPADPKSGRVQDTAWRTLTGAGHQHFLSSMRVLAADTTADQLRAALFAPWAYSDAPPSLRWDPMDDRRHALRWKEPTRDPIRTVRGGNALAIQGLPLFPTQPQGGSLLTTGFRQIRRRGTFLTWPIWERPIGIDVVRSVLALRALQEDNPPREPLRVLGVVEVLRSQRITQGKFRNFTQGAPV